MIDLKHSKEIKNLFGNWNVPAMRQASLSMFIDHLLTKMGDKQTFTQKEVEEIMKISVETYKAEKAGELLQRVKNQILHTD